MNRSYTDVAARRLRLAIVLGSSEEACTVYAQDRRAVVPYAVPFPRPRAELVAPGHLVAITSTPDGTELVVWRWFDAVVLEDAAGQVRLWEPFHGEVLAKARELRQAHWPGSRAYLSAGLEGADWWVTGTAVDRAEDANVDVDEVQRFLTAHDLWNRLQRLSAESAASLVTDPLAGPGRGNARGGSDRDEDQ